MSAARVYNIRSVPAPNNRRVTISVVAEYDDPADLQLARTELESAAATVVQELHFRSTETEDPRQSWLTGALL